MKSCNPVVPGGLALALLCGITCAQSTASPYPAGGVYPYDNAHSTSQLIITQ